MIPPVGESPGVERHEVDRERGERTWSVEMDAEGEEFEPLGYGRVWTRSRMRALDCGAPGAVFASWKRYAT
jgi:hypothetical protein